MNKYLCLPLAAACLATAAAQACANAQDYAVEVRTGHTTALAVGSGAGASVNIGGVPGKARPGCAKTQIQTGSVSKIAIGPNARAEVEIAAPNTTCEDKP